MPPRACLACGSRIPASVWVEGRKRNTQNRRYCLTCSPFGSHNTRDPRATRRAGREDLRCVHCGRLISAKQIKGTTCWTCLYGRRAERRLEEIYKVVGDSCWRCGYCRGKAGRRVLDFHHVNGAEKCFGLDCRHLVNLSLQRVVAELRKCVLLCANCHREVETRLVPTSDIREVYVRRWATLEQRLNALVLVRRGANSLSKDAAKRTHADQ